MTENLQINIGINTEYDSPERIKSLILGLMGEAGDRFFAIESVTIDGKEIFKVGIGFIDEGVGLE